ncbi:pyroglutamyl-peptidase I [Vibrio sp. CAU 1672]|uniref:pyroglutamyl-peptidase I n=1 Tax=Vibrio sp. CAU 1672 TaxID=3032594 RepID=UPI0023DBF081|nr:pyroglutamyl-peptidase I [Vibrio sp. CAU 1672]MDF2153478.1 pyroglutamyl-peptidase I [Vibrio sp. CAU 1672]
MKKILITGFEPFAGALINPALEAIQRLSVARLDGGEIVTCSVPVVRYESVQTVIGAIKQYKPDVVITVGQAAGRAAITPERVAINLDDFRIADNAGNQPVDEPVIDGGPAAYFSSLPIKAISQTLQQHGIPCQVSNTAGTFVCNHLFYAIQHFLRETNIRHGFVHIPLLPGQNTNGSQPTMALETIVEGLRLLAQATIEHEQDVMISAGQVC